MIAAASGGLNGVSCGWSWRRRVWRMRRAGRQLQDGPHDLLAGPQGPCADRALRAAERESGRRRRQRGSEMIAERGPSGRLSLRGSFE